MAVEELPSTPVRLSPHLSLAVWERPSLAVLPTLVAEGFTHLLTVEAPSKKTETLGLLAESHGLQWRRLPLHGGKTFSDPAVAGAARGFIADLLAEAEKSPVTAFIHCKAGLHRTGMMAYAFARSVGLGPKEAQQKLREMRPLTAEEVGEERLRSVEELVLQDPHSWRKARGWRKTKDS